MSADKIPSIAESSLTNNGERTVVVSDLAPGAAAPPHYHTDFTETFTLVSGGMTVFLSPDMDEANLKPIALEVGEPVTVPLNTLHSFVVPDELTHVKVVFNPGTLSFEKTILIMRGLQADEVYTHFSSPTSEAGAMFYAVMSDLTNTVFVGKAKTDLDQLLAAKGSEIEATKQAWIAKYASEKHLKQAAGIFTRSAHSFWADDAAAMDNANPSEGDEDHVSPTEINQILRRKRKARERRACYPCRQRKVKCNYETPCQRCIDRDHVNLCSYQQVPKGIVDTPSTSKPASVLNDAPSGRGLDWNQLWSKLQAIEASLRDIKTEIAGHVQFPDKAGPSLRPSILPSPQGQREIHTASAATPGIPSRSGLVADGSVHLGRNSVPAMALALGGGNDEQALQTVVGNAVLPLFGLDNETATYPFTDLWGLTDTASRVGEVCKLIPSDADCFQYLRHYRDNAHVLYPAVVNIDMFESELTAFLVTRADPRSQLAAYVDESSEIYGRTVHWISLLFACLASGCQCSSSPRKGRQLTAQVYVCCAYECLRISNHLSRPTPVDIQSLLVIGNVIANNMNAGVAWSLLGLTARLAQTIGLHEPAELSAAPEYGRLREEIWWRIVWQDSLLSILFDRSPATFTVASRRQHSASEISGNLSYIECMKRLCAAILDIVRDRSVTGDTTQEVHLVLKHRDRLNAILADAAPHLTTVSACRSMRHQLEHWNLSLHLSYVMFDLHRAALRFHRDPALGHLREACINGLAGTVNAYLGLQRVSSTTRTSWIAMQRALSSALLLGIIREHTKSSHVHALLQDLLTVMTNLNADTDPTEVPAPMARGIMALRIFLQGPDAMESDNSTWSFLGHDRGQKSQSETTSMASPTLSEKSPYGHSPFSLLGDILWGTQSMHVQGLYRRA
ncbi:hypothetical protein PV08_00069 [Exophiala spinifera]|uniref:Zn(2)-C6 fungal-type domain-containing protein n=1 Tax=Exophiala spinifera TaxID=91928 RepID=A0A0D2A3Q8_9EURO|nr:uncharacterized protein PV08_00069 [Exophiala spinifera]KIW19497.1 hypothetical protein PV08_00069 [Exophiala spinifera]